MSIKLTPRKSPSQGRAKATVDAMLEAAVRLSRQRGLEPWTTNQAAELAGVSIGTLYQYFPSKESLVTSLAVHRRELRLEILANELAAAAARLEHGAPAISTGVLVAQALVQVYGAEPALDAELERYLLAIGAGRKLVPFDQRAAALVATYLARTRGDLSVAADADGPARTVKVVARAAVSVLGAIALEEPARLGQPDLLRDVACVVDGALAMLPRR